MGWWRPTEAERWFLTRELYDSLFLTCPVREPRRIYFLFFLYNCIEKDNQREGVGDQYAHQSRLVRGTDFNGGLERVALMKVGKRVDFQSTRVEPLPAICTSITHCRHMHRPHSTVLFSASVRLQKCWTPKAFQVVSMLRWE